MQKNKTAVVYLALGANLGPCRQTFVWARQQLAAHGVMTLASSPLYLTAPVGGPAGQQEYLNAVICCETTLLPLALLELCLELERQAGRRRLEHWGPRPLDLDLLFYDDRQLDTPQLQLPHPRLHLRRFVLEPLGRLAPDLVHPRLQQSIQTLLSQLTDDDDVRCIEEQW